MNAVKSGITARPGVILPGESAKEFEATVERWRRSLRPATPAEEGVVLSLAAFDWQLQRLQKFEHQRIVAAVETKLAATTEGLALETLRHARIGLEALAATIECSSRVPTEDEVVAFGGSVGKIISILTVSGVCPQAVALLNKAMGPLSEADGDEARAAAFVRLGSAAREAAGQVVRRIQNIVTQLDAARSTVADAFGCLDDKVARQIDRQRRRIQQSMRRDVELLNAMRGRQTDTTVVSKRSVFRPVEVRMAHPPSSPTHPQ